jgi:site-specific recombinase XerD
VTLVPSAVDISASVPTVRAGPLDRLPGTAADDPLLRLAAAWLLAYPTRTATVYRRDLEAWAAWCAGLSIHPFAAERHHVDAWVRHLTTTPQPRTGRPAAAASIARRLSALSSFYDHGIAAEVLTHSPVASVRRPRVSDESQAVGLTTDEVRRLIATAVGHSPRSAALVLLLTSVGLRISEALGTDVRDFGHDHGHRVIKVTRKGGRTARAVVPPQAVRALEAYIGERTSGPIFLASDGVSRYPYKSAYEQLDRLTKAAKLPAGVTPHSLRHAWATEADRLRVPLQDIQDGLGHADPRTTRRYIAKRNQNDRSPNYAIAAAFTSDD